MPALNFQLVSLSSTNTAAPISNARSRAFGYTYIERVRERKRDTGAKALVLYLVFDPIAQR